MNALLIGFKKLGKQKHVQNIWELKVTPAQQPSTSMKDWVLQDRLYFNIAEGMMFIGCVRKALTIHSNNEAGESLPGALADGHFMNKLTKVAQ